MKHSDLFDRPTILGDPATSKTQPIKNPRSFHARGLTRFVRALYATTMRVPRSSWTTVRATIAVVALYALALQAVLGGILSVSFDGTAHQLCLQGTDGGGDGPAQPLLPHCHLSCCTAAHTQPALDTPGVIAATIAWPLRHAVSVIWRPEVVSTPRAPPRTQANARAPPVV